MEVEHKIPMDSTVSQNDNTVNIHNLEHNGDIDEEKNEALAKDELLFFSYHEVSIEHYKPVDPTTAATSPPPALIMTHFPNPYNLNSATRVVRIPRDYSHSTDDTVPYFSNVLPGYEKAALTEPALENSVSAKGEVVKRFIIRGSIEDGKQWFGYSSVSPLSDYLLPEEFTEIVDHINSLIKNAFNPLGAGSLVWSVLDLIFFTVPSLIRLNYLRIWDKGKYTVLEEYIEELNSIGKCYEKGIKVISPKISGFLSLDFEIPTPIHVSTPATG